MIGELRQVIKVVAEEGVSIIIIILDPEVEEVEEVEEMDVVVEHRIITIIITIIREVVGAAEGEDAVDTTTIMDHSKAMVVIVDRDLRRASLRVVSQSFN